MRLAFAFALALVGAPAGSATAAPRDANDGAAKAAPWCHCAVKSQPTTLAIPADDREQQRTPRLDALAGPGVVLLPLDAAIGSLAAGEQTSSQDALDARRGYDATAPPAQPLG